MCQEPYYLIDGADSVIVLPLTKNGHLVLVKQYRYSVDRKTIEFPAGYIGIGEPPIFAAARELMEETGYECNELKDLGTGKIMLNRYIPKEHLFIGLGAKRVTDPLEKDIEVVEVAPSEFKEMIKTGQFDQLAAIGLWFKAQQLLDLFQS